MSVDTKNVQIPQTGIKSESGLGEPGHATAKSWTLPQIFSPSLLSSLHWTRDEHLMNMVGWPATLACPRTFGVPVLIYHIGAILNLEVSPTCFSLEGDAEVYNVDRYKLMATLTQITN